MPKKITLQVELLDGQVVGFAGNVYRAAMPCRMMSLPGRPPEAWFQAQLLMSDGSFEPPPVKVKPVVAPWATHSTAVVPLVPFVVEQLTPVGGLASMLFTCWQTRSQSSGGPVPEWFVTALPSSSNAPVLLTANAGGMMAMIMAHANS